MRSNFCRGKLLWISDFLFNIHVFGPPEGGRILFLLSPEVSGTSGTMSIYIQCSPHNSNPHKTNFSHLNLNFNLNRILIIQNFV